MYLTSLFCFDRKKIDTSVSVWSNVAFCFALLTRSSSVTMRILYPNVKDVLYLYFTYQFHTIALVRYSLKIEE